MRVVLLALLLGQALAACQAPPAKVNEPDDGLASDQLGLVRAVAWPGGGSELTVIVRGTEGEALTSDMSGNFIVESSDGSAPSVLVKKAQLGPGYTGILIDLPAGESDQVLLQESLEAFISERPGGESIGLFLRRDTVVQLASFTANRSRLSAAIRRLPSLAAADAPMAMGDAIPYVLADTLAVGGQGPSVLRAVVVAAELAPSAVPTALPVLYGLAGASQRLQDYTDTSIYSIVVCDGSAGTELSVRASALAGNLVIPIPTTPAEDLNQPCDLEAIAAQERSYPERLEFLFSPDQRSTYDARAASLSTADFALSVRVGDKGVATATAHLRGKGTLGCERKSYTLRFDGPGRKFFSGSHSDEYYLLSMCADDRYVQQYTANQLMSELGLFPLSFRYIELLLDGEQQGVYLLLEKAREELVRDSSRVQSVMRRRFDVPNDIFEVKYTNGISSPEAIYQAVVADADTRAEYLDIDQYLSFLALMSAYQNGDYIDEIWVSSTETLDRDSKPASYFSMMAWDNDDLFSECHYTGKYAFVDPHELAYCAEAGIDALLLSDPLIYARFVDILEETITERVPEARFQEALDATSQAIMPLLDRPGVSAAMLRLVEDNPGAVDPQEAKRDVQEKLDRMAASYRARRDLLMARIQAYRQSQ